MLNEGCGIVLRIRYRDYLTTRSEWYTKRYDMIYEEITLSS